VDDPAVPDETWVRSYLDSNCAHCHLPGGSSRAFFDARLSTPLANQSIVCGPVIDGLGSPAPAVVKPGSLGDSVMLLRMNTLDECCSMPPLAKGIVDDEAVARVADWILGMEADSCTKTQSFYGGGSVGANPPAAANLDTWRSNLVIDEDNVFTNTTGASLTLALDRFTFKAGRTGDPVTPFVVKVNGNNNFTVRAVGTPRGTYLAGDNDLPFSDSAANLVVAPGETIAAGFLDANPDGSGGTQAGIVTYQSGGAEIWHTGGTGDNHNGSVAVGLAPVPGNSTNTSQTRDYDFSVSYLVTGYQLGNGLSVAPGYSVDGANSNLVINETDTFTNTTANPMTVTVERFRFHASRQGDPVTPFLVRVNADNNFTVVAIGTTRASYNLANNDFPFGSTPVRLTIAPGEKIAPGFVDAYPDGSGGTGAGVVSYEYAGTDQIYYSYDVTDVASSIALGEAPVMKGYQHADFTRDYYFGISLGFGGKEDEDGDGLPDKWELAWSATLTSLSGLADSDQDGTTDAAELEAGTDPTDPASVLLALGLTPGPSGTTAIATVKTIPGRFYRIEASTTLQSWTVAGTWKAASWPATSTEFSIPQNLLPSGFGQKLFIRVSPGAGN
jgi:hypothetical protein